MAMRKAKPVKVGRGNGEGSKRTQFKKGQPSPNPEGRGRQKKQRPPASVQDAMIEEMRREVIVSDGKRQRKMPRFQVMIESMFDNFTNASLAMQVRALQQMREMTPEVNFSHPPSTSEEAAAEFVGRLAEEHRRKQEGLPAIAT